jgi:hypothetical protein
MKLCPQCEFIYEDDQRLCDMDGRELIHDPSPRAFPDGAPISAAPLQNEQPPAPVTKIHVPIPEPMPRPAAAVVTGQPSKLPSRWQPRGLALAALAGLVLVTLLFVVYYARTHQSQTGKPKSPSSQSANQYKDQSHTQAAQSADTQSGATVSPDSAAPLGDTASEQALAQPLADHASNEAEPAITSESSSSLATGPEKSALRVRPNPTLVAARASSDTGRVPVIIRLNNGASIKADEAWEKREGVWYRQAGMVTFLKRSRVKSIQRSTSPTRSQTEFKAEKSIAKNQPRVGKPQAANQKNDSKVTSFLKKTGRILKKPFKL